MDDLYLITCSSCGNVEQVIKDSEKDYFYLCKKCGTYFSDDNPQKAFTQLEFDFHD